MGINGLLYSQIGYDLKDPMRALIRSTDREYIPEGSIFELVCRETSNVVLSGEVKYWGDIWKSSWWELDFSSLYFPGNYKIVVKDRARTICSSDYFTVGYHVLWDSTIRTVALEQLETRARLARNGRGWKDCGSDWREVNSHATMLIGLCDLLSAGFEWLAEEDIKGLFIQLEVGCDYIAACQDKAVQVGYPEGAIIHEIPNHMIVIPGDVAQSVVAFTYASRLISELNPEKSKEYLDRAVKAYEYLINKAEPYGESGFSHMNNGAPEDFKVPKEWMTRDMLMMMWGGIELFSSGKLEYKEVVKGIARKVMKRQVPECRKEGEFYGHFYAFDSCDFTEKANAHHHVGHDTGSTFPHYIIPFIEMTRRWYDDPEADLWRNTVKNFAYGYFLPACSKNPFYLLPEGYFKDEGLLVFCGPWHGINTSIGFAASLAVKLEGFTGNREFRKIAVGNIQWIAGLNSGITRESMQGCVIWKEDIPEGVAESYSQIHGIGRKYVGNWTGIRGTICNGFSVNPQFRLEVKPTVEADEPRLYTDEDWIPHSAGWISALTYLRQQKFFAD